MAAPRQITFPPPAIIPSPPPPGFVSPPPLPTFQSPGVSDLTAAAEKDQHFPLQTLRLIVYTS
jgi:hypothetical protein